MALAISNILNCPKPQISLRNYTLKSSVLKSPASSIIFPRAVRENKSFVCASASAAGGSRSDNDLNPYEVLGVNPIEGFNKVKAAYETKRKEAEIKGDEAAAAQLEKAYDKLMMAQLTNRKKGVTYGSFKVAKDIKYADKQPIVPWGPRFTKSSENDMRINLAISAAFTAWILIKRNAEYKPLQFLAFAFVYRIFEKLKSFEPPVSPTYSEDGEDEGRTLRLGKRILRSLALVFGSITFASLAYTVTYLHFLYNNQELLITTATSAILYILASYYL
ncbi:CHLOROPLAST J-LIKE DOMAIN 1 [Salix purpurea]|uniref:CHLOROPLAST J-LIKE DOMAIN 1 n=1 Tax=Salix purpurea TaxID=77065 RepID=A0A9Q0ZRY3_SALPP|nr:CHLOROPLAST J-LIKE DOMAIN 1 [Salix purpurea]